MRAFSQFEKNLIRELVKQQSNANHVGILDFIKNVILNERLLILIKENPPVDYLTFVYKVSDKNALSEFFETIALVDYLERNHLVFKHKSANAEFVRGYVSNNASIIDAYIQDTNKFGVPKEYVTLKINTNLKDKIEDYANSYVYIGTELKYLVQNNFKTDEDIKHHKEMVLAKISLWIAIAALLFSFLSPFLFDTKIEQKQIESIIEAIKTARTSSN